MSEYSAPLIKKPCVKCGKIMECTAQREICTPCRREMELAGKRRRAAAAKAKKLGSVDYENIPF